MSMLSKIGLLTVVFVVSGLCVNAVQEPESTDETLQKRLVNDYNVYALPLPEKMDFAGEPVPLHEPISGSEWTASCW